MLRIPTQFNSGLPLAMEVSVVSVLQELSWYVLVGLQDYICFG